MINIIVYGKYDIIESYYRYKIIKDNQIIKIDSHLYNIKNTIGRKPTIVARGIYNALLYCKQHKLDDTINITCNDEDIIYVIQHQNRYTKFNLFNKLFKTLANFNYTIQFNKHTYKQKEPDIKIYVDGSYNKNTKHYGWAYTIYSGNKLLKMNYGQDNIASEIWQVAGELSATMRALEYCDSIGIKNICIYYDYSGIEMWAINKWKAKNKWTKMYQEFMLDYMQDINISFTKVKSHNNNMCNNLVDKLAKRGCGLC